MNEDEVKAMQDYWAEKLDYFEQVILPVFAARGYGKNTALYTFVLDELDDSVMVAVAAKHNYNGS